MLEAIAALGRYTLKLRNLTDPIQLMVLDPKGADSNAQPGTPEKRATKWWVLAFRFALPQWQYCGISEEEYDRSRYLRYYLTEGPSMGALGAPTAQLTEPDKTLNMRIVGWANKALSALPALKGTLNQQELQFLEDLAKALQNNRQRMLQDLTERYSSLRQPRHRFVVTCQLTGDCPQDRTAEGPHPGPYGDIFSNCRGPCYPGDLRPVREVHRWMVTQTFEKRIGDAECAICRQKKKVSGRILSEVFPFATLDKPGFVAGGLNPDEGWRAQPICFDCFLQLKEGRRYVEEKMTYNFYGTSYWLVPQFMVDIHKAGYALSILDKWDSKVLLTDEQRPCLTDDEDEILCFLSEQGDYLALNFVFLRGAQAKEEILLSVEDVLPSRLHRLFEAKDKVDKSFLDLRNFLMNELSHIKGPNDQAPLPDLGKRTSWLEYNFGRLRPFFVPPGSARDDVAIKPFLDITGRILRAQPVSRDYLIGLFVNCIRSDLAAAQEVRSASVGLSVRLAPSTSSGNKNRGYLIYTRPVEALMNLEFLTELNLLMPEQGGATVQSQLEFKSDLLNCINRYFDAHQKTFSSDEARAAFLMGTFVQMLLDVQASSRDGATPFWKKLKGLKLSPQDMVELFPQVYNKLQEYDKLTPSRRELASCVAHYISRAGHPSQWKISNDEANLYMVMGMSLLRYVIWPCLPAKEKEAESETGAITDQQ